MSQKYSKEAHQQSMGMTGSLHLQETLQIKSFIGTILFVCVCVYIWYIFIIIQWPSILLCLC